MPKGYDHFKFIYSQLETDKLERRLSDIEYFLEGLRRQAKPSKELLRKKEAQIKFINEELNKRNAQL